MREKDEFDKFQVASFQERYRGIGRRGRDCSGFIPLLGGCKGNVLHSDTGSDTFIGCKVPLLGLSYPLKHQIEQK